MAVTSSEARAQAPAPGSEIALWHSYHKRFVVMGADGLVRASTATYSDWTPPAALPEARFRVIDAGGGKVALYNAARGRFVALIDGTYLSTASTTGALPASATAERLTVSQWNNYTNVGEGTRLIAVGDGNLYTGYVPTTGWWTAETRLTMVVTAPPPVEAPPGWEFTPGRPGMPAVLLIHGLAASSLHFTNPLEAWNVKKTHYDHDRPVASATGTSSVPKVGLLAVEGSGNDPQSDPENSMYAYLVDQGFSVATWDQAPCVEATAIPTSACLDGDTFDAAYKTAPQALAKLASLTTGDIVVIGHSRGGLIVRRLLKDTSLPGRSRVKTAITIHTPHQGTSIAGKGNELLATFASLDAATTGAVPSAVADVVNPLLAPVLATPKAIIDHLVTLVGLKGAQELTPSGAIYTALKKNEVKPAGVRVYTFGGTSVNVWRLHAWVYTAASATPGNGFEAQPTQLVALPDAFPSTFAEMTPGSGDLLVTDTSSKWAFEDAHFTNPLNHGEVLWSRAVQRKIHELILGTTLPPEPTTRTAYAPAVTGSADEVLAWVKQLEVMKQLGDTITAVKNGDVVTLSAPSISGVALEAFSGPESWHVAAGFSNASLFDLGTTFRDDLGTIDNVVAVLSKRADQVPLADLPPSIKDKVAGYASDGVLSLRAGVNLFAEITPANGGMMGKIKGALGFQAGPLRLSGAVGYKVLFSALTNAGVPLSAAGAPTETELHLQVELPPMVPAPFNLTQDKSKLHVELDHAVLAVDRTGSDLAISGSLDGRVWIANQQIDIANIAVTYNQSGTTKSVTLEGGVSAQLDPFGVGVKLTKLGVKATYPIGGTGTAALGVTATVTAPSGTAVDGDFTIVTSTAAGKTSIDEFSIGTSDFDLTSLGLGSFAGLDGVVIKAPRIGLKAATKDLFVTGGVSRNGAELNGVLYARRQVGSSGFALFLQNPTQSTLNAALGTTLPFDLPVPEFTLVASTVDLTSVDLTALPAAAQTMVDDVASQGKITLKTGLALITKLDLSNGTLANAAARLGLSGSLAVIGAVTTTAGKPSFSLQALLPTITLPSASLLAKVVTNIKPSFTLALTQTSTSTELSAGIAGDFNLNPAAFNGANLVLKGAATAVVGTAGAGVRLDGQLVGEWATPFGLKDIIIGDTSDSAQLVFGLLVKPGGVEIDLAVKGKVKFVYVPSSGPSEKLAYGAAGNLKALFVAAVPVPVPVVTGLGIKLEADELSVLAATKVGQVMVRAIADKVTNIKTATGGALPPVLVSALNTVKSADLVKSMVALVPAKAPLSTMLNLKIKGVAAGKPAEIYLATPGLSALPDFNDVGFRVSGALYNGTTKVADATAELTATNGLKVASSAAPMKVGPLQLGGATVNIEVNPAKLAAASFAVKGKVSLFGVANADVAVAVSSTLLTASMTIALGGVTGAEIAMTAAVGGAADDLRLSINLQPANVIAGLKEAALKFVGTDAAAQARVTAAVAKVVTERANLDVALAAAEKAKRDAQNQITQANAELAGLRQRDASLVALENDYKSAISSAWTLVKLDQVIDYTARLSAIAIERAALAGLIQTASAAVSAASGVTRWAPVRLHPDVILAQGKLDAARIELEIATMTSDARAVVSDAISKMAAVATAAIFVQSFKLQDASLKAALAGTAQTFTVTMRVNGKDTVYSPTFALNPPSLTFDKLGAQIFESAGGVPSKADITARINKLDLGYGDVWMYKDKSQNGTASWIAGQRVGAAGWGELAVAFGGWQGKIYGITYDHAVVGMTDKNVRTNAAFTASWEGPALIKQSFWKDYPLDAMTGGWQGYTGIMSAKRFVIFKDFGQVYDDPDFDPSTDLNGNYFSRLFGGHDHVYYLTTWTGDLYCYKPGQNIATGQLLSPESDGDPGETSRSLNKISSGGWNDYAKVFGGANGVIYGVRYDGKLFIRRHTGRADCSDQWGFDWMKIGDGWDMFQQVLGGEDGVIYAVRRQALPLTPGSTVGLYSPSQQRFLRALDTGNRVDGSDLIRYGRLLPTGWTWERWTVIDAGGGLIALRNPSTGRFMVSTSGGEVELSANLAVNSYPAAAKFKVTIDAQTPRGHIRLWSNAHSKFVYLKDRDAALAATRDTALTNGYTTDVFEVMPVTFPAP
ncbi:MAG: hypothetical protein IPH44_04520 [Myxococcales bacterium]|nr:hypothetical protein [Myxococcales bacterium]